MHYIYFETIDSTNNEAKRMVNSGKVEEDTCISATVQTQGRGRQGKSFFSPDSGLYMTVVFPVDCPISTQVTMTTRTACAVSESIETCTGIVNGIKWVNDIFVRGKKCCGILCEAVNDYETGRMRYLIAGIGINIYTKEWPKELRGIAGSLYEENPVRKSDFFMCLKKEMTVKIAENLKKWLFETEKSEFLEYYKAHSIVLGKKIIFTGKDGIKEAYAEDIDESGGLIVRLCGKDDIANNIGENAGSKTEPGEIEVLSSGEISLCFAEK